MCELSLIDSIKTPSKRKLSSILVLPPRGESGFRISLKRRAMTSAGDSTRSEVHARAFLLEGLEGQSANVTQLLLPVARNRRSSIPSVQCTKLNVTFKAAKSNTSIVKSTMNISTSRIHRQTIAQDSKSLVLSLLGRLQRALADGTRPPQHILNEIRHITLDQQDLIRACVSAVRDVVSSRQIDVDADVWKEFFDLAPERQHLPDRDPRRKLRALASLTAIWGLEVTEHYGWKSKDTKNLEHLRRCALAYPDFDTFSKVANIVMLRRHEHSLFNARTPSIGYTSRGPRDPSPLTLQDLQILNQLSNKKNRGDVQHGRLLTAECVDDEKELIRVREWSRCSDGGLMIGDQALRNLRPQHYHQYLLEEDRFGLLCAAESTTDSGVRKANKRSGDSVSPLHAKLRRTNADRASGPNIVPGPDYQSRIDHATRDTGPSDNRRAGVDEAAEDSLQSTTCLDASVDTNKGRRTDGLTKTSSLQISASNLSAVRRCRLGSTNVALSTTSDNRASSEPVSPYSSMQKDLAMDRARSTTDPSTHQDPPQTPARIPPLALPAGCVDQAGPGRIDHSIFDHTSAGQHADILHSEAALENMETILSATHEEFTGPMAFTRGELDDGNATDLVVFPPGICDSKRSVLQHWAKVAHETESRAPHPVLKHWLHPIRYASIQSISASDESVDIDARTHDVLEMPYDVFRSRAGKGEVFSTPLLIREAFADAGEFSAKDYADSLQHTFPEMEVDVRYHSSEPEPLSVAEAARLVRAPPDTVLPNAPDFLDLESLSSAIKPGLTRLPSTLR